MALQDQLDLLGLTYWLSAKCRDSRVFQLEMAKQLRAVTMASLTGALVDRNGQAVDDSPAVASIREVLLGGAAAVREENIYAMSALPKKLMAAKGLYIGFQLEDEPSKYSITYQTAQSGGPHPIPLSELRQKIQKSKLQEFDEAIASRDTNKLAPFLVEILAITDKRGHTIKPNVPESSLEHYLVDQAGNATHATNTSLAVLADVLNVNIVLCEVASNGTVSKQQRLNEASYEPEKQTLCVVGGRGHWDALVDCQINKETGVVSSGRLARAVGDGNCGYNAVALALAAATNSRNAPGAVVGTPKITTPVPWEEKIKKILAAGSGACANEFEKIQKGSTDDASMLREKIIDTQKRLLQGFAKGRDPSPITAEPSRTMTPEQQKQIKDDEKLALELAAEEAVKDHNRFCP